VARVSSPIKQKIEFDYETGRFRTPEEIRRAAMHSISKAFDQYFDFESDDLRNIYRDRGKVIKIGTKPAPKKRGVKK
jgi:hypothetical protein